MAGVLFLRDIDEKHRSVVSENILMLSKLRKAGFNVPNGFVITPQSFQQFLKEKNLVEGLKRIFSKLDETNLAELDNSSKLLQEMLFAVDLPKEIDVAVKEAYQKMGMHEEIDQLSEKLKSLVSAGRGDIKVVVKPFVVGANRSFTLPVYNVRGVNTLKKNIIKAWTEVFQPQNLYFMKRKKLNPFGIGVFVQEMINAEKSCVISTFNPVNGNTTEIVIEACYGFGNAITEGELTPDLVVVSKTNGELLLNQPGIKEFLYAADPIHPQIRREILNSNLSTANVLDEREIKEIFGLVSKLEAEIRSHAFIEIVLQRGKIHIVNVSKETSKSSLPQGAQEEVEIIKKGRIVSAGIGEGRVVKIASPAELNKLDEGSVAVPLTLSSHFLPSSHKISAIVSSCGGIFSKLACWLREKGIAGVVIENAHAVLSEGANVVVNGYAGTVGKKREEIKPPELSFSDISKKEEVITSMQDLITATKIGIIVRDENVPALHNAEAILIPYVQFLSMDDAMREYGGFAESASYAPFLNIERKITSFIETTRSPVWIQCPSSLSEKEILKSTLMATKNIFARGFRNVNLVLPSCVSTHEFRELGNLIGTVDISGMGTSIEVDRPAGLFMGEFFKKMNVDTVLLNLDSLIRSSIQINMVSPSVGSHKGFLNMLASGLEVLNSNKLRVMAYGKVVENPDVIEVLVNEGTDVIFVEKEKYQHTKYWAARFEKQALLELLKSKYRLKMR